MPLRCDLAQSGCGDSSTLLSWFSIRRMFRSSVAVDCWCGHVSANHRGWIDSFDVDGIQSAPAPADGKQVAAAAVAFHPILQIFMPSGRDRSVTTPQTALASPSAAPALDATQSTATPLDETEADQQQPVADSGSQQSGTGNSCEGLPPVISPAGQNGRARPVRVANEGYAHGAARVHGALRTCRRSFHHASFREGSLILRRSLQVVASAAYNTRPATAQHSIRRRW